MIIELTGLLTAHQATLLALENEDRLSKFNLAQELSGDKPLITIGQVKRNEYPCSDVVLDIDSAVLEQCETGIVADVTAIPYQDKFFGAAFASHVLEHLTEEDVIKAWSELWRVADNVIVAFPSKFNLIAVFHPDHKLWINWDINKPNILEFEKR